MTTPQLYTFLAPAEILPETMPGTRPFSGVAYSGGVITDHGYFSRVVFDLSTLSFDTPAPLLLEHERDDTIGVINQSVIGQTLVISGKIFTGIDDDAASVAAKADAGFPWQMSVGIFPGTTEEVPAGQALQINGQTLTGPLTVFRNARVREVSFCAVAADSRTSATVFTTDLESPRPKEPPMADAKDESSAVIDALKGQIAANEQSIAERDTTIADLKSQIEQFHTAKREGEVKTLFADLGREFSADASKPYMGMSDEQFTAISADLKAMRQTPNPHLFSAVATGSLPELDARAVASALNAQVAGAK